MKSGNIRTMLKLDGDRAKHQAPSLPPRNKTPIIAAKNYSEVVIKVSCSCPILLNFFNLSQIFCPGLSAQTNFC